MIGRPLVLPAAAVLKYTQPLAYVVKDVDVKSQRAIDPLSAELPVIPPLLTLITAASPQTYVTAVVVAVFVFGEITKLAVDVLVEVPGVVSSRSKMVSFVGAASVVKHKMRVPVAKAKFLAVEPLVAEDGP